MSLRGMKRKKAQNDSDSEQSASSSRVIVENDEIDISSALTGKHTRKKSTTALGEDSEDDYEELEALIKDCVTKRDMKEGTKLLKKTKGKAKISKGEVGGGSFQSMGMRSI